MCPTAPDLSYLTDCIAFSLLLPRAAVPVAAALDGEMSPGLTVACLGVRLVERPLCLGEELTRRHRPVRAWERSSRRPNTATSTSAVLRASGSETVPLAT